MYLSKSKVKKILIDKNMSITTLHRITGRPCNYARFSRILNGAEPVNTVQLNFICKHLNCTKDEIIE